MLKFADNEDADMPKKTTKKHHQKKKNQQIISLEEENLAGELFGNAQQRVLSTSTAAEANSEDQPLWAVDTSRIGEEDSSASSNSSNLGKRSCEVAAAAWVDDDDEDLGQINLVGSNRLRKLRVTQAREHMEVSGSEFEARLRSRFSSAQPEHMSSWAKLPDKEEEDYERVLRSTKPMKVKGSKTGKLVKGELDILRCKDANAMENSRAVVRSVAFHPKGEILMTAGLDKTVRFFNIDGKKNAKIDGVFFKDMPIYSADWCMDDKVVLSGRRPYYYMFDVHSGISTKVPGLTGFPDKSLERLCVSPNGATTAFTLSNGYVGLVDNRINRVSGEVKMNGTARSICFGSDSNNLVTSGGDADIYVWDLRKGHRCVRKWQNEGGMPTCGLAMSSSGKLAAASESGVVNLFDVNQEEMPEKPVPSRSIMNLRTPVEFTKFNHDGQLLAMASRFDKSALRMVHVASGTVFSNWPTSKSPLNYIFSFDFSPTSGYFAVGNDKGRVLLYRLRHYGGV